jgi:2-dehydropantoate 2-reductase
MRFIMYGAGAIGGVIGAYLAQAGRQVVFVDNNDEHVDRINQEGLTLKGIHGTHNVRATAVCHPREVPFQEGDVCFLAVKSYDTLEAMQELQAVASPTLQIFCTQNGVRNEEIVERYFPGQTNGAVLYLGAIFGR